MKRRFKSSIKGEFSFLPPAGEFRVYRLLRSWVVVLVLGVFLTCFSVPLFLMGAQSDFSQIDDLFSLVFLLFTLFWMLGWSFAVLIIAVVFLAAVFGRERLIFTPGRLKVRYEILGMGFTRFLDSRDVGEFAWLETPDPNSGISWRGSHVTVALKGELISVGTDITAEQAVELQQMLEAIVLPHLPPDDNSREFRQPKPDSAKTVDGAIIKTINKASDKAIAAEKPARAVVEQDSLSSIALVAANFVPVAGVLFLDWRVSEVMLLYWAESAVIGLYNLARMWVVGRWSTLLMGPFFVGHYGAFMAVHLLFLYSLLIQGAGSPGDPTLIEVFEDFVALAPVLGAFFVSHGISYYRNFLGRKEYVGRTISE